MAKHVNLNLMRSLQVLLEERHVSHAAEKLHITQSAASRHLSQLRQLFDDPLLVRDGNALVPTPKALHLQAKLENWFLGLEDLLFEEAFDPKRWQEEFILSSSDYVAQYILPYIIDVFALQAPSTTLSYRLWNPQLLDELASSDIHLASSMSQEKPEGLCSEQIGEDFPVCIMGAQHPLASKDQLSVEDLLQYGHIKVIGGGDKDSYVDTALNKLGHQRRVVLNVPFFYAATPPLCKHDLLMITPEHIARNFARQFPLVYKPLPIETPCYRYWLIWHERYDQTPSHQWARAVVLDAMTQSEYSIGYDLKS